MVWINALVVSAGGEIIGDVEAGKNATPEIDSPAGDEAAAGRRRPGAVVGRAAGDVDRGRGGGPFGVPERQRWLHGQLAVRLRRRPGRRRERRDRAVGRRRHRLGPVPGRQGGQAEQAAAGRHQPGHRRLHEVPGARRSTWSSASPRCRATSSTWSTRATRRRRPPPTTTPRCARRSRWPTLIRESINEAGPRPITPYYNDVSTSVQITWHPATSVRGAADAGRDGDLHDRRPAGRAAPVSCQRDARRGASRDPHRSPASRRRRHRLR